MKLLPGEISKIGVLRALQLGDMLCSVPALRALRRAYPQAEIVLFGLPWASEFTSRFSMYLDRFMHFPGYPGLPEQEVDMPKTIKFIEKIRDENFDLIVQMQGNGTIVNSMLELFGAKYLAGFHPPGTPGKNPLMLPYPGGIHETERHLELMEHLGVGELSPDMEFPILQRDLDDYRSVSSKLQKPYACIHPGSRGSWRQWPTAHFAAAADRCYDHGLDVVITGTAGEAGITGKVIAQMNAPAIDLTGKTSLGAIGCLIKNASLLISNCTGVSHIAAALKTPGIVISMDGEPERWGPLNKTLHHTFDWARRQELNQVLASIYELCSLQGDKLRNNPRTHAVEETNGRSDDLGRIGQRLGLH